MEGKINLNNKRRPVYDVTLGRYVEIPEESSPFIYLICPICSTKNNIKVTNCKKCGWKLK